MIHTSALREQWKTYSQAAAAAGRTARNPPTGPWHGTCSSRTRPTRPGVSREGNSLGSCIQYILDLTRATAPTGIAMWKRDEQQADSDCTLDYFMDDVIIAGDPEHVTRQLLELREQIGPFGTLVLTAHDWDDRDRWTHSLELFAREVVPAFNKAIGATEMAT